VSPAALPNAEAYLARLETLPSGAPERYAAGPEAFAALLERLHAAPDPAADARLQAMTIHKAKGLQFDTVILPGLGRRPRGDDPPLLRWLERPTPAPGGAGLLLAPIHEAGPDRDPVFDFLAGIERERERHETDRLLYVAVTRARHAVHLLGHAVLKDGAPREPDRRSLLARLWPALADPFAAAAAETALPETASQASVPERAPETASPAPGTLRRLGADWRAPAPPSAVALLSDAQPRPLTEGVEFRWAGETARHVGTVVHRLLRLLARQGAGGAGRLEMSAGRLEMSAGRLEAGATSLDAASLSSGPLSVPAFGAPAIAAALAGLGVPPAEREAAATRVREALARTLGDPRGRWVLEAHAEARSEYALTALDGARAVRSVMDRTFVDEAGVRWIVDFKTGVHEGGDTVAFLDREQARYREQLERYAAVLARLEPDRPIRLALYFPLLQAWREWAPP
jgi:ATP-dependent exoDNAse (exonuclease V) beta subunit